jgi:hypothetical protein
MREPTATEAAYLAGMIDGDGYITIHRSVRKGVVYHAPMVGIAGTRREPHDLAASMFGGRIHCYAPKNPRHRPQFQWCRQGASAVPVIQAVAPYLLIKTEHAWLALELWQHVQQGRSDDPFPWHNAGWDPRPERDDMRQQMVDMNQSRRRCKAAAGRLLDGVEHNSFPGAQ